MDSPRRTLLLVCRGPECGERRGSIFVHRALEAELRRRAPLGREVRLDWQSCFGQCRKGVNVLIRELRPREDYFFASFRVTDAGSALYHGVTPEDAATLVGEHVIGGQVVERLRRRHREQAEVAAEPQGGVLRVKP